ncbi:tetraspanin-2-like [Malania oleifera]|uniref:tetraspanin-2-like n=1 Tax=Malania oleifera TaxID=397392 RepID=UPI0025AEC561|nr:tetraspanin-2-like [Malania oleifera]
MTIYLESWIPYCFVVLNVSKSRMGEWSVVLVGIFVLFVFLVFAFVITRLNGAFSIPGWAYWEYSPERFSSGLWNRVTSSRSWNKIKTYLAESNVFLKLNQEYVIADQFFAARVSPLQSGCCKPPTVCGYTFVNPITWKLPIRSFALQSDFAALHSHLWFELLVCVVISVSSPAHSYWV